MLWWFLGCFGGFQGALVVSRVLLCGYYGVLLTAKPLLGVNQGALVVSRVLWFPGCFGGF